MKKITICFLLIFIISTLTCSNINRVSASHDTTTNNEPVLKSGSLKGLDISKLDKAERNWFFKPRKDGLPSEETPEVNKLINKYSAYYLGDTSKKILYLTFDEGYENGYTGKILDILKKNNVKAAFFVTTPYIKDNPDLIKRMVNEGHLVCNHTAKHPSMAERAKNLDDFQKEFTITEEAYKNVTGKEMPKFFRPPMGKYSELSLFYTKKLGYKTIFWSFAYNDWNRENQPSAEFAKQKISSRTHNGAIILLHAVSKTNSEILDSVIQSWKEKGYTLESLDKLP
ncbi:delta-lactam-biosynthetic de-N-acetylase [Clostridium sp. LBM24168]